MITFHITFALKYDECIASATTFLITNDSHTLYATESFKLPTEVIFCSTLVLEEKRTSVNQVRKT